MFSSDDKALELIEKSPTQIWGERESVAGRIGDKAIRFKATGAKETNVFVFEKDDGDVWSTDDGKIVQDNKIVENGKEKRVLVVERGNRKKPD